MPLVEWRDEFSVGVASVDHEHRELIDLINETYENLMREDSESAVAEFLWELYAKISAHFAMEEKVMRDKRYDQYQDHKDDHERLLDDIRDIMDKYEDHQYFNDDVFGEDLRQWFTVHFKTKDARLHKHMGDV